MSDTVILSVAGVTIVALIGFGVRMILDRIDRSEEACAEGFKAINEEIKSLRARLHKVEPVEETLKAFMRYIEGMKK